MERAAKRSHSYFSWKKAPSLRRGQSMLTVPPSVQHIHQSLARLKSLPHRHHIPALCHRHTSVACIYWPLLTC